MEIVRDVMSKGKDTKVVEPKKEIRGGLTIDEVETIDELKLYVKENELDIKLGNAKDLDKAKQKVIDFEKGD